VALLNIISDYPPTTGIYRHIIDVVVRIIWFLLELDVHLLILGPASTRNSGYLAGGVVVLVGGHGLGKTAQRQQR